MTSFLKPAPTEVLHSEQDASVNFIWRGELGYQEARYVRRASDYLVVYLSSQTGCEQACRFCHLTATGQNKALDVGVDDLLNQAATVLSYYDTLHDKAQTVHFNFMARGEPLSSNVVLQNSTKLFTRLSELAFERRLYPKFLISTILPSSFLNHYSRLVDAFPLIHPEIYYSLYSVESSFRRRWLPRALGPHVSLALLKSWQDHTAKIPRLHFAFIEGENDSEQSVDKMCSLVREAGLIVNVNIVRYNPFSGKQGKEPSEEVLGARVRQMQDLLPFSRIKIVKRVGSDVYASCGQFVSGDLQNEDIVL